MSLTDRQLDCLRHAADGHTQAQIARTLHLSNGVVTNELQRTREILDARNTAHAIAIAYRTGILSTDREGA